MIPLFKPHMPALPELNSILQSGNLAYGTYGRQFERSLCEFFGSENILVTNTFNMAILVALTTLNIRPGDAIIASPMACLASTQPLLSFGLKVVWADIDPKRGSLCPESLRAIINANKNVKGIVHNHFCGYPGYIDEVRTVADEFGLPVIDDGIEGFGSEYKGKRLGNVGSDVTFFSFNPVRIPNTLDGGAVIFKDKSLFEKAILVRDAGINRRIFRDEFGEISPSCDITIAGHSATPMEINTYIGVEQMKKIDSILLRQRENALAWKNELVNRPELVSIDTVDSLPNYWVYGLLSNNRKEDMLGFRENGFYSSGVHINNNRYSAFGKYEFLPGVEKFNSKFLAIPSGWWFKR